ncbi:hypothetical protein N665_0060s0006 [Sinapis alba]|nr:hypothetical protein N665_0060s0006 [Sinapis alba]
MLIKSLNKQDHVVHLRESFQRLNLHKMKLNPAKCRFAVASGEFLGYLVTYHRIEANPKKIDALIEMASPKTKREVQRLTVRKSFPTAEALLGDSSSSLETRRGRAPVPIYSIIGNSGERHPDQRGVRRTKADFLCNSNVEALFPISRNNIPHNLSTANDLQSPSQSGRLAKWVVELSLYDIEYRAKTCAKSQVLADFLVELPTEDMTNKEPNSTWILHVDGSLSKQGSGIGSFKTQDEAQGTGIFRPKRLLLVLEIL